MKLITITQLSEQVGLSVTTIRRRVASGSLPYTRANTKASKLLFDIDLVQEILRQESISNLKGCNMGNEPKEPTPENTSYLANLFKPSTDPTIAEAERDSRLGYTPRNTVKSASFTK